MLAKTQKLMIMKKLMECVPNFSEGRDMNVIKQITDEIEAVEGVKLLNVDPGKATNRTVVTFVGEPEAVVEAAFRAIAKAAEVIDMRKHHGEHPRMGATDVVPFVPVAGMTMDEAVQYARKLAERVGNELNIPVYLYEFAATSPERKNLANIRAGEYEALPQKLSDPHWKPDFGPAQWNEHVAKTGATVIGARKFLIAYNVNLNTTSTRRANSVAFDVRQLGRVKRIGDPITGEKVLDENGEPVRLPGTLRKVKAIGWYIDEYGICQISMNLTDIDVTPMHIAFDEVSEKARLRGLRVTGSEIVGLVPLKAMLDAGKYFLKKQRRSLGIPEEDIINIAIRSLGLNDVKPFNPDEKIIEYMIRDDQQNKLVKMNLREFANETSRESPAPGGGSISAYIGSLGASLSTMVANLSSHKRGWDDKWEYFSNWAEKGQQIKDQLLELVDEDTAAFNKIMEAFKMPKKTEQEKLARNKAIEEATKYAISVPLRVMELAYQAIDIAEAMIKHGLQASLSDAAVGLLSVVTAIRGAHLNVKINAKDLKDQQFKQDVLKKAAEIEQKALLREQELMQLVNQKLES